MVALPERFWAKVQKTPTCWLWQGSMTHNGYGHFWLAGKVRMAHRLAFAAENGPIAPGLQIDHRCFQRACVNPVHLQAVTQQKNRENLTGAYTCNRSGVRGVTWYARRQQWVVRVRVHGELHHGGYFADLSLAAEAAVDLRNRLMTNNLLDRGIAA